MQMSSATGKRQWVSSSSASAASDCSDTPQPSRNRVARVPPGTDEPPEVSPEYEEELLEALRADDASQSGRTPRCPSPSPSTSAAADVDPADVTTWFPRVPQAAAGLPPRLYPWQAQCLAVRGVAEGMK